MKKCCQLAFLALAVAFVLTAAPAQAQQEPNVDAERFKPAVTHDGFVTTEGSAVRPEADRWELGLFVNYARGPLLIVDSAGDLKAAYVENRVGFDVMASLTVVGPFAIGLDLPFFLPQTGDSDPGVDGLDDGPSVAGLGDLRLVPKLRILDDRDLFGLAVAAELRAPTHAGDFSGGARMVVFAPKLIFDHRFARSGWRIGANAGVTVREGTDFYNIEAASEFSYAAAVGYRFGGQDGMVKLGVEVFGGVGLVAADREEVPLEGLLYGKINPTEEWEISFGPGMGLVPGYGIPTFRAFAGVRFRPTSHDRDGDGISDDEDKCPDVAEDKDGDEDLDGCPEEDRDDDQDGIPNYDDDCPDEKETINGIQDEDGCPDGGPAKVIRKGGKIEILENVLFRTNSAQIDPGSYSILNQVALTMKANPDIEKVRVEGHTDDTGPREGNVKLSQARADSVRRYLIARGVSADRLTAEGHGPDRPIAEGTDAESRKKNRRVEFIIEQ
ncbi:MAG: OmpA family protein [Deltaproteobacteria bacterium]|nr:OmpA family protein [Deltaproteobacteria bacterium]